MRVVYGLFSVAMGVIGFSNSADAQGNAELCRSITTEITSAMQSPGVPSACSRVEELRAACSETGAAVGEGFVAQFKELCDMKRKSEVREVQRRSSQQPPLNPASPPRPSPGMPSTDQPPQSIAPQRPQTPPQAKVAQPALPTRPTQAALAANQTQVLAARAQRLQQSLTRIQLIGENLQALVHVAQQIGESYVERRTGSVLAYSSKEDDALADSRGYRKRESENFVVFYRTGDMTRAQTLLGDAEAAIKPISTMLGSFPLSADHRGRKLPIYLAQSHEAYTALSKCPEGSDACISHLFFDDGVVQTAYFSSKSYQSGGKAEDRVQYFQEVIQHELTHYAQFDMVTKATSQSIPKWFSEGLASYVGGQSYRMTSLTRKSAGGAKLLSMSELQAARGDIFQMADVGLVYEEGYSIFEMLVAVKGLKATRALVIDVTQNEDFESALGKTLGMAPQDFDEVWREYLSSKYGLNPPASNDLSRSIAIGNSAADAAPAPFRILGAGDSPVAQIGREDQDYVEAMDLYKASDFEAASRSLSSLIFNFPGGKYSAQAHFWLGNAMYAQKKYDQAQKEFRATINYAPNNLLKGEAWLAIANCERALGRDDSASLGRVLLVDPNSDAATDAKRRLSQPH